MKNTSAKTYYITDNFLNLWTFRHTSSNEIAYEVYNNQHKKIHSAILAIECQADFLVNVGEHNDIHLVVRKNSGELLYYFFNGRKWTTLKLFHLENHKDSFYLLDLHIWNNKTHILYAIKNSLGKWLFIDLYWEDDKWKHVKFFESTIQPFKDNYASIQDHQGNIYILCQWRDSQEYQLQLCQLHAKPNLWNTYSISYQSGEKLLPNIWLTKDKVHICWLSSIDQKYVVHYRNKNILPQSSHQWSKQQEIYSTENSIHSPFFASIQDKLTILWLEKEELHYMQTKNLGESWTPSPKIFAHLSNPKLFRYLTKNEVSKDKSFYILLDEERSKTYPLTFFIKQKELENKISKPKIENLLKKNSSNILNKQTKATDNTTQINVLKNLDEATIKNLNEEDAKKYIRTLKNIIVNLYKENTDLKKQKLQNTLSQSSVSKDEKRLHSPSLFSQNKETKQTKKEQLKIKMIQEENNNLKSNLSQYQNIFERVQQDMETLKDEIWDMSNKNKKLQQEISELKENTLGYKISKFFTGK